MDCENREGILTVLRKATFKGIRAFNCDVGALRDAWNLFMNQTTPERIGNALKDNAVRFCGGEGRFASITTSPAAENMIEWRPHIEARRAENHPAMKMVRCGLAMIS